MFAGPKKRRELEQLLTKERERAMVITDGCFSPEPKLRAQLVYLPPLSAVTHVKRLSSLTAEVSLT